MAFLFDNLTATVVGMSVILILLNIQIRATQSNVAETTRNMVKTQAQSFSGWMEEDFGDIGKNMQPEEATFENPQKVEHQYSPSDSITTQFTFYKDTTDADGNEYRLTTEYLLESAGTRVVEQDTIEVFALTRVTDGDTTGRSPPALGYFDVEMLDRDANLVTNPKQHRDTVRSFRARFSVVAPFEKGNAAPPVPHYGSVNAPYRLSEHE